MKLFSDKKVIIWDWNGTLLDDVNYCVECINNLLDKRKLPEVTATLYREIFTFPIIDYYRAVGFDLDQEGFEKPAMEFIGLYYKNFYQTKLFPCVKEVLEEFQKRGLKQVVLSAMEHDSLVKTLGEKGILKYFDEVTGVGDHYGSSKEETGKRLLKNLQIQPEDAVIIGDTLHDKQVADTLNIDLILVSTGHNSEQRLKAAHPVVVDKLDKVPELIGF
jgi:phosphoglycolate phosphatase